MANLCDVTYRCIGDRKQIKALKKVLDANNKRKTSRIRNGFGTMWIGNIIDQLGYDWHKHTCRGEIVDYQMDDDVLVINMSTCWSEQEGFREVIEDKFSTVVVYYRAEETGCDYFVTNSFDEFPDRYFLDSYEDPQYFETLEEAQKYIVSLVGHDVEADFNSLSDAIDKYQEEQEEAGEDCFYSLHEFTEVDD